MLLSGSWGCEFQAKQSLGATSDGGWVENDIFHHFLILLFGISRQIAPDCVESAQARNHEWMGFHPNVQLHN